MASKTSLLKAKLIKELKKKYPKDFEGIKNKKDLDATVKKVMKRLKKKTVGKMLKNQIDESSFNLNNVEILVNPKENEIQKYLNGVKSHYSHKEGGIIKFLRWMYYDDTLYLFDGWKTYHYIVALKLKIKNFIEDTIYGDVTYYKKDRTPKINYGSKKSQRSENTPKIEKLLKTGKYVNNINEDLQLIKFSYNGKNSHDPKPRVKVLDFEYPGIKGQKTYGKRKDLLGWNTNNYKNKKYAEKAIDDIDSFARLLSADKKEKYERIKHFFPEQAALLRRYIRDNITNLKTKKRIFWKKTNFTDLIKFDKESF